MSFNIIGQYFNWHYKDQAGALIGVWKNFLRFNFNYFSLPILLKTLFYPWRKYQWFYGRGFEVGKYLQVFISNLISRILGAMIRSLLILIGLLAEVFIALAGATVLVFWLALPILLLFGLWFGFKALF